MLQEKSTFGSKALLVCLAAFTHITFSSVAWTENFVNLLGVPLSALLSTFDLCFLGVKHNAFILFSFSWIVNEKYSVPFALAFTGLTLWT